MFDCGPFENPFWSSIRFSGTEPFRDVCQLSIWCQPQVFAQKGVLQCLTSFLNELLDPFIYKVTK